ncbi:MAG: peptide ABC transporter substrate-binding protein [Clostridiales bacterium]|jgi:oligopeptide transport system substrate-binding protein|nr:peptide ABC transporter substrate-binding protein [Clostridiales bacterium]
MRKYLAILLIALLSATMFTGCGSGAAPTAAPAEASEAAPAANEAAPAANEEAPAAIEEAPAAIKEENVFKSLKIGIAYDPSTLDPGNIDIDSASDVAIIMYDSLLRDNSGQAEAGAAASWSKSDDNTQWTFTLRDGLVYSDGSPITSEDFAYGIRRVLDPELGFSNASGFLFIKGATEYYNGEGSIDDVAIETPDAKTLVITYTQPTFETEFTSYVYTPVSKALSEAQGQAYGTAPDKLLSNGPFKLTAWVPDASLTLVKNESYWAADQIKVSQIDFVVGAATSDTAVDMILAGDIQLSSFTNMNQITALTDEGFASKSITTSYRCMNTNNAGSSEEMKPFMSNVNFRKALNLAINREQLSASVLTTDMPAYRLVAPSEMGYSKAFVEEYPYQAWPTQSSDEAKAYLDKALEELGKTIADVPPLVLLCFESESSVTVLSAVQDMILKNLGLPSTISSQTIQNMISMAYGGQYDLWYGGNEVAVPDFLVSLGFDYTTEYHNATPGLRGYTNPEYDALYKDCASQMDYKARKDKLFEVEKFFCENVLNIVTGWTSTYYVSSPEVVGVQFRADGSPDYSRADLN